MARVRGGNEKGLTLEDEPQNLMRCHSPISPYGLKDLLLPSLQFERA